MNLTITASGNTIGWTKNGDQICAGKSRINWHVWTTNSIGAKTGNRNFGSKQEAAAYAAEIIDAAMTKEKKWW